MISAGTDLFAARLDATSDGGPGWRDYLDEMYRHVWAKDFWTKEVYLGVRLGQRGMRAQFSGGMFSQFINAYRGGEQALGLTDEAVSDAELARWTEQSERLGRALSASAMRAQHATSEEIAWLFRHTLAGTVGDPPPSAVHRRRWGTGEIEALLEGQVENGRTMPCPSPGSPMSCRSRTGSRGCTSLTRCRSRSRSAPGCG